MNRVNGADVIVVGLHLRWHGVWQRPNHIISRLAREVPVIVLEEPIGSEFDGVETATIGNVTVVTPRRFLPADAADTEAVAAVRELVGERQPLIWLYTPMMLAIADAFPEAFLVYDKMDELASFAHADPRLAPREQALLLRADTVFTGGRSLQQTVAARAPHAICIRSGVESAHFADALTIAPHPFLDAYIERPIFGYIGVIDERIDLEIIDALAAHRPDATVMLVGPVAKIDEALLPRRPNIVYAGSRRYDELPAFLAGFDVALMPFARNDHTRNISPTKTLEYLAAGRRTVSTAIADVVADYDGIVDIAYTTDDFLRLVDRGAALESEREERIRELLAQSSWDAIADRMLCSLGAARSAPAFEGSARRKEEPLR